MPDINYAEKWGKPMVTGFNHKAITGDMFSAGGDFSGNYTYHDMELGTVPLSEYDVTKSTVTSNRYGNPVDVSNTQYDYTVAEKISFAAIMDEIYNQGLLDEYKVGKWIDKEKDEVISPNLDKVRMRKWVDHAGFHVELPTGGLTTDNIVEFLMDAHNLMRNAGVPANAQLTMRYADYTKMRLAKQIIETDELARKILPKGSLALFDDMNIVAGPDNIFPANCRMLISHKDSLIAPTKVKDIVPFEKCETHSGSQVNFLMIHDAFVRGHKASGVLAIVDRGSVCATPTVAASSGKWAITSTTSSAVIKYTTDGTDPRFSKNAKVYSGTISADPGTTIKASAEKEGLYWSDVAVFEVPKA